MERFQASIKGGGTTLIDPISINLTKKEKRGQNLMTTVGGRKTNAPNYA